jgi:hypothetical protein
MDAELQQQLDDLKARVAVLVTAHDLVAAYRRLPAAAPTTGEQDHD